LSEPVLKIHFNRLINAEVIQLTMLREKGRRRYASDLWEEDV